MKKPIKAKIGITISPINVPRTQPSPTIIISVATVGLSGYPKYFTIFSTSLREPVTCNISHLLTTVFLVIGIS